MISNDVTETYTVSHRYDSIILYCIDFMIDNQELNIYKILYTIVYKSVPLSAGHFEILKLKVTIFYDNHLDR